MSRLDMINMLPDEILCRILSFLPTKVAVTTSILSKKWTRLWLSVPTLDFKEEDLENAADHLEFICMVYNVIVQRDVTPVENFCLHIGEFSLCCDHDVNTWVKAAIQRGVQRLSLRLQTRMDLPSGILGSRTLVVLKLGYVSVNTIYTNGFPSLKVLHLDEVGFGEHQYLARLIFGCPILEELYVRDLKSLSNDNVIIGGEFQSLNKLVSAIILSCRPYIPLKWICEVKSLRIYEEFLPNFEVTCTFCNLTSLMLIVDRYNWSWFVDDVLRNCPKLQNFEIIHTEDYYNDSQREFEIWPQPKFVPECLSKHLRTCTLREYQGWNCELQFSRYIMQKAKVLRIMRICSGIFANPREKLKIIKKLSLFPRRSATCELHLNVK